MMKTSYVRQRFPTVKTESKSGKTMLRASRLTELNEYFVVNPVHSARCVSANLASSPFARLAVGGQSERPRHGTEALGEIVRRREERDRRSFIVRTRRVLREQWNGGDDGEKPRETRHFRNCRESFAAAATVFRRKMTHLDRTAEFFEDGTSDEHFAEFGRLQVKLGWLNERGSAARGPLR